MIYTRYLLFVFFFNDTATTEIYTLSLHDALPISRAKPGEAPHAGRQSSEQHLGIVDQRVDGRDYQQRRSEEHTSELQSPCNLVCRLLLEKKKIPIKQQVDTTAQPRSAAYHSSTLY